MKKLLLFSLFALLASAMGWAATETWTKVTSQEDLTDGDYLIVYEETRVAFNGSLSSTNLNKQPNDGQKVEIVNNSIETGNETTTCDFYFTIAKSGNNYTIKSCSGSYIGKSNNKSGMDIKTTAQNNTISIKDGVASINGAGGAALLYNKNWTGFRYYANSNVGNSGYGNITLYKKSEGPAPQPTPTQVAALEINPGFGTIEVGTEIKISCATEGAVLNGTVGKVELNGEKLPYTFTASEVGELKVAVKATQVGLKDSEPLSGTFIVNAAVPVAYSDEITEAVIKKKNSYQSVDYNTAEPIGALYNICALAKNGYLQFNDNKATDKNKAYTGIVMKTSQAAASKLIITWDNSKGNSFEVYGKNTPYTSTKDLYGVNPGNLIEKVAYSSEGPTTVDLGGKYTYIAVKPKGGVSFVTSFEFIWNEGAAGGADVTYTKASEAKAGNFAVLATADGMAVGRNTDLNPAGVKVLGDAIGLDKSQADVDEFEIVEKDAANKIYQLCGGLSSDGSRRFLTHNADGGVTTTAATVTKVDGKDVVSTTDDNADVTFVSTEAGLLVKFNDGKYLMFNGTNFVKGEYTEVATQAEGKTLTPVIVFMSSSNVSTGVETVEFDENAEAQYFNLNGVQVKAENLTPGLYIVRQGNKVSKQVIR